MENNPGSYFPHVPTLEATRADLAGSLSSLDRRCTSCGSPMACAHLIPTELIHDFSGGWVVADCT